MTKEQDKRIAIEILNLKYRPNTEPYPFDGPGVYEKDEKYWRLETDFKPSTDASDDYLVLKHIRENWDYADFMKMKEMQQDIVAERWKEQDLLLTPGPATSFLYYEPGDYSRAALKVLDGQKTDKKPFSE